MSMASRGSSHTSGQSGSTDKSGEYDDPSMDILPQGGHKSYKDRTQAWWSVGEYLENGRRAPLTHQSAKFTLTGNRVFANQKEDLWDLSDSLMELYEQTQTENITATLQMAKNRKTFDKDLDPKEWLSQDTTHGYIQVHAPDTNFSRSQLIPLTLSTSAHKVCLMLGISLNALHIQLHGDIIRRLDPYEHPLVLQNEYLAGLGYSDISRIQHEGLMDDLCYLIKFYAGKPFHDSTFSRNQLQAYIDVRKGKVIHQWAKRLCVISGTRLQIYKDKYKRSKPTIVQLAKGSVEEVKFKGHELCLKLTSTLQGERSIYLSFTDQEIYNKWYRKCKKGTDKLPASADLSNCHLEFLPETIFINDQLSMLNLRHNVLKERPIEEDIYTIGWIDDLPRFQCLRSLNLADNNLTSFPVSLCYIKTLAELNIASNKLEEIPPQIAELINLQALHIHNNHLSSLPDELVNLRKLFILVLAFNRFMSVPAVVAYMTDVRISEVENIIMAGNQIEKLPHDILTRMKYAKKVDFRMNQLTLPPSETVKFTLLEHLTHLDIRDNHVIDLDVRALKTLEYLNCERNEMHTLQVNGSALKNLFAGHNKLEQLTISPKPEWLLQIEISHNLINKLPEWLSDCFFLQKINASHNQLSELPTRIFMDAKKLKSLRVNHNKLESLPSEVDTLFIEEIFIQHNAITKLPNQFLEKANKLRLFNASKNKLTQLPPLSDNEDLNKLQELYLTSNCFGDSVLEVISGYPRLKILHLAHNEIYELQESYLKKLEVLQEFNISGNQLRSLPDCLGDFTKLVVLRAHSNLLNSLPDFKGSTSLRVLDVGHNRLLNVSVTSLMASQLNLLDMSLNAQLKVDPQEFKTVRHKKTVCLVDLTGQNRLLPGLDSQRTSLTSPEEDELDPNLPWKAGFSETSGIRNKLCVATLKMLKFGSIDESLFAMFDGGRNNEVPKTLLRKIPQIIKEELRHEKTGDKYMKYAMLTAHRQLENAGQRLGASSLITHLRRMATNHMNHYTLQLANVGDVEAVLCRRGEAVLLTRRFTTTDREECHRVFKADGIITEDNKVSGSTKNTRLLGSSYLYPHVIPDPFTNTVLLRHDDEFIIIANRGLWKYVDYSEAVEEIYEIGNPVVAAKKLQDLAQGYGSKENIGILVIRLNTDQRPSLWRLRRNRSMSIDDFEAAQQHQARKIAQVHPKLRASTGRLSPQNSNSAIIQIVTGNDLDSDNERSVSKCSIKTEGFDETDEDTCVDVTQTGESVVSVGTVDENESLREGEPDSSKEEEEIPREGEPVSGNDVTDTSYDKEEIDSERLPISEQQSPDTSPMPPLKPLPNQRFRKNNAAIEWEAVLQKRLMDDVKDKEMKLSVSQLMGDLSRDSVASVQCDEPTVSVVDIDPNVPSGYVSISRKRGVNIKNAMEKNNSVGRLITPPWAKVNMQASVNSPNPTYTSYSKDPDENEIINMTAKERKPKVRKTIMMFENITRENAVNNAIGPAHIRRKSFGRDGDNLRVRSPDMTGYAGARIVQPESEELNQSSPPPPRPKRSVSLDLAEQDMPREIATIPKVQYNKESGSHTTVISIPGGTVTSSNTDTQSLCSYDLDVPAFTVRMVNQHHNEVHNGHSYSVPAAPVGRQSSYDDNITVVEIARL